MIKSVPALLVLKALSQGAAHGYRIASWVNQASDGQLELKEGTLYPLLHSLEEKGLIQGEWRHDLGEREVRVYQLTHRGRRRLQADEKTWRSVALGVDAVLREGGAVGEPL